MANKNEQQPNDNDQEHTLAHKDANQPNDNEQAYPLAHTRKSEKSPGLLGFVERAISKVDEAVAVERVEKLRKKNPTSTNEELIEMLIRNKCIGTGIVGAATSSPDIIPGLGTVAAITLGTAADIGMSFKMQAELVLEIAYACAYALDPVERRNVILLVTGVSMGAERLLTKVGTGIAEKASERFVQKSLSKAIPFIGIAAAASANMLTTYVIGKRAHAYFSLGPDAVGDWAESVRAMTGVDERKITGWLGGIIPMMTQKVETTFSDGTKKIGTFVSDAGKGISDGAGSATEYVVNLPQKLFAGKDEEKEEESENEKEK